MKTNKKTIKNFYEFGNYVPNKNAVPVTYKGTQYLSKAQCMALEGITRKELDIYLKEIKIDLNSKAIDTPETINPANILDNDF